MTSVSPILIDLVCPCRGDKEMKKIKQQWLICLNELFWASQMSPLLVLLAATSLLSTSTASLPHIILVLADDIGWTMMNSDNNDVCASTLWWIYWLGVNDVPWNNRDSDGLRGLGSLAKNGVVLEQAYTLPICTPSRFALLVQFFEKQKPSMADEKRSWDYFKLFLTHLT